MSLFKEVIKPIIKLHGIDKLSLPKQTLSYAPCHIHSE